MAHSIAGHRPKHRFKRCGHTLLEAIVAAAIFVMVSIALSGIWVMYGKALAKSSGIITATAVARSTAEALAANGWEWLEDQKPAGATEVSGTMPDVTVERIVRARTADITYKVSYTLKFNPLSALLTTDGEPIFPTDICAIQVLVRSSLASEAQDAVNSEVRYSRVVYGGAL